GQDDPDATLIGRPSRALAEADPDETLTPATTAPAREQPSPARTATEVTPVPATPPPVREPPSLAGADPDATLITRPSPPPAHSNDRAATDRQPAVQPATPPPTSAGNAGNASRDIPPLPAQTFIPQPGMGIPRVDPPPRNAPAPEFLATPPGSPAELPTMPPGRPVQPPAAPKRNIFQTGKTLLLVLLALIVLAGGGALLVNAVVSSQHTARTGPASAVPGQQKSTASALQHVVNPYAGAQGFLDPDWVARVKAGARQVGGTLGAQEVRVAQYSTAVWLTSIASVKGGNHGSRGLAGLLDAAETQAASSKLPIVVTLVLADLPNRNCANPNAQNELQIDNGGLRTYESSYIDAIANTLQQPRYRNLRVVAIIEPGVLATVATDLDKASCLAASSTYALGIQYALNRLHALPNVYNYLDIAHPDWLGWNDTFHFTVSLMSTIVRGTTDGFESIDGFASDIGNYVPTSEPYLTANQKIGGKPVRSATFYLGNPYLDMLTYDRAMRQALIASGFPQRIGMLIDTSRNGWGGPDRPSGPSASKDLNTFVNASRIDRRSKRGNWCNQPGGLGARPQADPLAGIAAFVWISRPGLSDGLGMQIPKGKQNPKGLSPNSMCIPGSGQQSTGAMPGSPIAGAWFQAGFNTLVQNAYPPL
ncbi:MAG TPA: glycoside hydrolase family 6 protein, partial [Ktedonobacteraceae bacterium]|nr:glycoside hydrolase family 6 protein [Ktedonobacteraceae bacterium]